MYLRIHITFCIWWYSLCLKYKCSVIYVLFSARRIDISWGSAQRKRYVFFFFGWSFRTFHSPRVWFRANLILAAINLIRIYASECHVIHAWKQSSKIHNNQQLHVFFCFIFFYNGNFYSPQGFSVYKVLAAWNLSKHKMQKGQYFCQLFGSLSSDTALTENASQIILSLLCRICNVRFIVCTTQTAENLWWGFYCQIF